MLSALTHSLITSSKWYVLKGVITASPRPPLLFFLHPLPPSSLPPRPSNTDKLKSESFCLPLAATLTYDTLRFGEFEDFPETSEPVWILGKEYNALKGGNTRRRLHHHQACV